MYTHAPSTPPIEVGIETLQASWMHSCVLPKPGAPQNSVIRPIGTPPVPVNNCLSISGEKVIMPLRSFAFWSKAKADDPAPPLLLLVALVLLVPLLVVVPLVPPLRALLLLLRISFDDGLHVFKIFNAISSVHFKSCANLAGWIFLTSEATV